jgi:hypothetical protein
VREDRLPGLGPHGKRGAVLGAVAGLLGGHARVVRRPPGDASRRREQVRQQVAVPSAVNDWLSRAAQSVGLAAQVAAQELVEIWQPAVPPSGVGHEVLHGPLPAGPAPAPAGPTSVATGRLRQGCRRHRCVRGRPLGLEDGVQLPQEVVSLLLHLLVPPQEAREAKALHPCRRPPARPGAVVITIPFRPIAFQLGALAVRWYGVGYVVASPAISAAFRSEAWWSSSGGGSPP